MAEYIEREALKERFRKRIKWLEKDTHDQYSLGLFHGCEYDADLINEPPAADVAPVRHARWVDNHCTACGMMPMGDEMWKHLDLEPPLFERFMDYCPRCGCRMDGGQNNETY